MKIDDSFERCDRCDRAPAETMNKKLEIGKKHIILCEYCANDTLSALQHTHFDIDNGLTKDENQLLRDIIPFTSKPYTRELSSINCIKPDTSNEEIFDLINKIKKFKSEDIVENGFGTAEEFSKKMPQLFIVQHDGQEFLVNTEGYNYCRYMCRISK